MQTPTFPTCKTVEGHPIEVHKWYEDRMGKAWFVECIRSNLFRGHYPVVVNDNSVVVNDNSVVVNENYVAACGHSMIGEEGPNDLMRPAQERMPYPWQDFPLATYAAIDEDHQVNFFTSAPYRYAATRLPSCMGGGWICKGEVWTHPDKMPGYDWETSLRHRPEGV